MKKFFLLTVTLTLPVLGACTKEAPEKKPLEQTEATKARREAMLHTQPGMSKCKVTIGNNGIRCKWDSELSQKPILINPITGKVDMKE